MHYYSSEPANVEFSFGDGDNLAKSPEGSNLPSSFVGHVYPYPPPPPWPGWSGPLAYVDLPGLTHSAIPAPDEEPLDALFSTLESNDEQLRRGRFVGRITLSRLPEMPSPFTCFVSIKRWDNTAFDSVYGNLGTRPIDEDLPVYESILKALEDAVRSLMLDLRYGAPENAYPIEPSMEEQMRVSLALVKSHLALVAFLEATIGYVRRQGSGSQT